MDAVLQPKIPLSQCVKVGELRKAYPAENIDLEKWMAKDNCLYVGRRGRVFIKQDDGSNKVFSYSDSDWRNPFKVGTKKGQHSLEQSLELYKKHILESNLRNRISELEGKTLGCFCDQKEPCHAKVLVEMFKIRDSLPDNYEVEIKSSEQEVIVVQPINNNNIVNTGICNAVKKDGKACTFKVKIGDKCGIHAKK
jgi:hypothetical protein